MSAVAIDLQDNALVAEIQELAHVAISVDVTLIDVVGEKHCGLGVGYIFVVPA
jgi:hypothetical protein